MAGLAVMGACGGGAGTTGGGAGGGNGSGGLFNSRAAKVTVKPNSDILTRAAARFLTSVKMPIGSMLCGIAFIKMAPTDIAGA